MVETVRTAQFSTDLAAWVRIPTVSRVIHQRVSAHSQRGELSRRPVVFRPELGWDVDGSGGDGVGVGWWGCGVVGWGGVGSGRVRRGGVGME